MKPIMIGSNAFGAGPDQPPSDPYPPHVADAESQRPDAGSPIGRRLPKIGSLADKFCVSRQGRWLDSALSKCRFPIGYACIRRNALCQLHHRGVEIVRTHSDVDHLLNNNRIAGKLSPALSREGAAMTNGHLADPVSTRERLSQNQIHIRRIVGVPTALVALFPKPAP